MYICIEELAKIFNVGKTQKKQLGVHLLLCEKEALKPAGEGKQLQLTCPKTRFQPSGILLLMILKSISTEKMVPSEVYLTFLHKLTLQQSRHL